MSDNTCAICLGDYVNPVVLGCAHSFCRRCYSSVKAQKCPMCREPAPCAKPDTAMFSKLSKVQVRRACGKCVSDMDFLEHQTNCGQCLAGQYKRVEECVSRFNELQRYVKRARGREGNLKRKVAQLTETLNAMQQENRILKYQARCAAQRSYRLAARRELLPIQ